jgi:hypothetical protein
VCCGKANRVEEKPSRESFTISPGSTSLSNFAPIKSKAQVSEAATGDPSRIPSERGRMPLGSRAAKIPSVDRIRSEYAPWTSISASAMASVRVGALDRATRWRMISVSDVVVKRAPDRSSSPRICLASTRFPL